MPKAGRWLSADPGGLIDGINLFRFCRNSPVNIIDRKGCVGEPASSRSHKAKNEAPPLATSSSRLPPQYKNTFKEVVLSLLPAVGAYRRYKIGDHEGMKASLVADVALMVPVLGVPLKIVNAVNIAQQIKEENVEESILTRRGTGKDKISAGNILTYVDNFISMTSALWYAKYGDSPKKLLDAEARRQFNRELLIIDLKESERLSDRHFMNEMRGDFGYRLRGITDFAAERVGINTEDSVIISRVNRYTSMLDDIITSLQTIHGEEEFKLAPPLYIDKADDLTEEELAALSKIGVTQDLLR